MRPAFLAGVLVAGLTAVVPAQTADLLFQLVSPVGLVWGPAHAAGFLSGEANPAGWAWSEGWELASGGGTQLGVAQVLAIGASGPGWSVVAAAVDAGEIVPGLRYRVEGARGGLGVRLGPLGLGLCTRVLRPVSPVPALGWTLDVGVLWRGPLVVGLVGKNLLSSPPFAEDWRPDVVMAVAWPWQAGPWSGAWAAGAEGLLLGLPTYAFAGEVAVGPWSFRAGLRYGGFAFGGSVQWSLFRLDWGYALHPVLPPSFRVSLALRFE